MFNTLIFCYYGQVFNNNNKVLALNKPDYNAGSIVNLVSSLRSSMGNSHLAYKPLDLLDPERLKSFDNIVFLLIDGLGYEYLTKHGQDSHLHAHLKGKITSVFPTTTSAALTSINTGVAPLQHAVTGWFMYLQEVASVTAILPFVPRIGGDPLSSQGVNLASIIDVAPVYSEYDRKSYLVNQRHIVDSDYSTTMTRGAQRHAYSDMPGLFERVREIVDSSDDTKFIYAYWPEFDGLCHIYGVESKHTKRHFEQLDAHFGDLLEQLQGSNTAVILTADHGLIDTQLDRVIYIDNYPELTDTLLLPLCGEPRAAYCYVKPGRKQDFEAYVTTYLYDFCDMYRTSELVEEGLFGIGDIHKQFYQRAGDYVLLMKENYVIKDRLVNEKEFSQIGVHGGLSEQELYVPLIFAAT